jgi:hypothetical protein
MEALQGSFRRSHDSSARFATAPYSTTIKVVTKLTHAHKLLHLLALHASFKLSRFRRGESADGLAEVWGTPFL